MSNLFTCQQILNRDRREENAASAAESRSRSGSSGSRDGAAVAVGPLVAVSQVGGGRSELVLFVAKQGG